jgi:hypothetical protein
MSRVLDVVEPHLHQTWLRRLQESVRVESSFKSHFVARDFGAGVEDLAAESRYNQALLRCRCAGMSERLHVERRDFAGGV